MEDPYSVAAAAAAAAAAMLGCVVGVGDVGVGGEGG